MYKLAIFDLDGTLINTIDDIAAASNYALRQMGFPEHATQAYRDFIGHGPIYLLSSASPEDCRSEDNTKKLLDLFLEYYNLHAMDFTKPYPGIFKVLEYMKKAGIKVVVYSNKPHDSVARLSDLFFPGLIDMSVGFREGVPPKPDPSAGFEIMRRFGVSGSETVYIGDSGVDMITGNLLGAYTIGVSWGFRPKNELESNGSCVVIDKADELLKIIVDK